MLFYRAENKIWRTRDEGEIHVENMTDSHLENAKNMMLRRQDEAAAWVREFAMEQLRRTKERMQAQLKCIKEQLAVERSSLYHMRSKLSTHHNSYYWGCRCKNCTPPRWKPGQGNFMGGEASLKDCQCSRCSSRIAGLEQELADEKAARKDDLAAFSRALDALAANYKHTTEIRRCEHDAAVVRLQDERDLARKGLLDAGVELAQHRVMIKRLKRVHAAQIATLKGDHMEYVTGERPEPRTKPAKTRGGRKAGK